LLVEGHYTDLQNYMRFQTNSYHSHDIISDIIELLNNYLNKKHRRSFENINQSFETLTEYIQGPCYENQIALTQGSFLDIASDLLAFDEHKFDIEKKVKNAIHDEENELMPIWMISNIKFKCSITLVSLIEGRKDNQIILRMLKSFHLEVLKRNFVDVFRLHKKLYNEKYVKDCFKHYLLRPKDENDEEINNENFSFIIECGFNLYILYSNFLEVQSEDNTGILFLSELKLEKIHGFLRNQYSRNNRSR